jgi:hypothetical protein
MPWSAKAQALLQRQYAPVGIAARVALGEAVMELDLEGGHQVSAVTAAIEKADARAMPDDPCRSRRRGSREAPRGRRKSRKSENGAAREQHHGTTTGRTRLP